jgi:NADPH:quinone reductase-like Zn-dependent oxidoreductase
VAWWFYFFTTKAQDTKKVKMNAILFHEFGKADVLRFEDAPKPIINDDEVLIQLKAASLNHLDIWVRSGTRERNTPLPHIPGSDGAGIVAEVGKNVSNVKIGERVLISPGLSCGECNYCKQQKENLCAEYRVLGTRESGTYAEFVNLPARNVFPIPANVGFKEAAAFPLVFLTAWHMLVTLAQLKKGETVLIHGAGSGVGIAAIQIARMLSVKIITTAGSNDKLEKAKQLGADEVINYNEKNFSDEVKRITDKKGVDVVFEHIGGDVFEKSIFLLRKGGRLVTCGATTDFEAKLDLRYLYSRHLTLLGSFMGTSSDLKSVLDLLAEGKLKPVIDSVYPLEKAADAQKRMEERKQFGKIVLEI